MATVALSKPQGAKGKRGGRWSPWLFALPALLVYVAFLVYPALSSLFFSLTNWDGLSATYKFVGLENYFKLPSDPVVVTAVRNNLIWTVVTIAVPTVIGLLLAMALNGKVHGKPILRLAHYIVLALSLIDSFKVFDMIYAMTYGGPGTSTQVLGTWMYFNVFQYYQAGYGTAIAVVITLVAIAVGIPYVRSQTKEAS